MSDEDLRRALRERFEKTMDAAIEAVRSAPDGRWIAASEWEVRSAFLGLMGECYQRIVQARIDSTPAAIEPPFSPCAAAAAAAAAPQAPQQRPTRRRHRDGGRRGEA